MCLAGGDRLVFLHIAGVLKTAQGTCYEGRDGVHCRMLFTTITVSSKKSASDAAIRLAAPCVQAAAEAWGRKESHRLPVWQECCTAGY